MKNDLEHDVNEWLRFVEMDIVVDWCKEQIKTSKS